jgi:putative transposase
VESAIRQAVAFQSRQGHPLTGGTVHHSDAGSQHTAVRFGETLTLARLTPPISTVGDPLNNALAKTTIGLSRVAGRNHPSRLPRNGA